MPPSNITAGASSIRVFLLIENRLLRESLVRLFRKRPDLLVVGQGRQGETTPCHVLDTKSEVLVTDSFLTAWLPANLALQMRGEGTLRALLVGMEADEEQFIAAVRFGVTGYLLQDAASDVLAAVSAVFRGEVVCPPQLCSALFRIVVQAPRGLSVQSSTVRPHLTLRQQQLVALVAKGLTNKEIASHLNLSEFTVRNHIHRILKQVNAESRSEAVEVIRASSYAINL
jgi:DNA-binding NarL/FixJ family response regulator